MNAISKTENLVLMTRARESLRGIWNTAVGITALLFVIAFAVNIIPEAGWLISLLVSGPLALGYSIFALDASVGKPVEVGRLFHGFRRFGASLGLYLLALIFSLLWAVLLIIPGIIAAYSYSMAYYILNDNDSIGPMEAIRRSMNMMRGNKWKLFCLHLRFSGWLALSILSLGIGLLWLVPYVITAQAHFYRDLKISDDQPRADFNQ